MFSISALTSGSMLGKLLMLSLGFLYTDGVVEATDGSETLFGTGRMLQSLNHHGQEPVESLLLSVKNDIDLFVGDAPQFDDITMLAVEIKTSPVSQD